jgi:cytoskeletal protein CcmA (bactofilin family)
MQTSLTPRLAGILLGAVLLGVIVTLIARALLPFAQPADPAMPGGVIVQADYTLDGAIDGDLVVFGNTVRIPAGARVGGNAWFVADTLQIDGQIDGGLTAIVDTVIVGAGGQIGGDAALMVDDATVSGTIRGVARITGDLLTIQDGGQIGSGSSACVDQIVGGGSLTCERAALFAPFAALIALRNGDAAARAPLDWGTPLIARDPNGALTLLAVGLALVGLAALLVASFPRQISRIEDAIRAQPRGMGGAGIALYALTAGVTGLGIVLLATIPPVGIAFLAAYTLFLIALVGMIGAGLVTLALVVGEWLTARLSGRRGGAARDQHDEAAQRGRGESADDASAIRARGRGAPPLVTAAVGGAILWLGVVAAAALPFGVIAGGVVLIAVSALGAGAALFTRLGTRPLHGSYFVQG